MADFPINDNGARVQYTATGGQTDFTIPFAYFEDTDILVYKRGENVTPDDSTQLLVNSAYDINPLGPAENGTIVLKNGATLNDVVTLVRAVPLTRTSDYITGGGVTASALNEDFDRIVTMTQQNEMKKSELGISYQDSSNVATPRDTLLPVLPNDHIWHMKSDGTGIETIPFDPDDDAAVLRANLASNSAGQGASLVGQEGSGTVQDFIDTFNNVDVPQIQVVYVGKHGNDANGGTNWDDAFLTIGASVNEAATRTPSTSNIIAIVINDGGTYSEDISLIDFIVLDAPNATLIGKVVMASSSALKFYRVQPAVNQDAIGFISAGGIASISVDQISLSGTGVGIVKNNTGILHGSINSLTVDTGTGIDEQSAVGGSSNIVIDEILLSGNGAIGVITNSSTSNLRLNLNTIEDLGSPSGTVSLDIIDGLALISSLELGGSISYRVGATGTLRLFANNISGSTSITPGGIVSVISTTGDIVLGGNLNTNGNNIIIETGDGIVDSNLNKYLEFFEVASAVNYIRIKNEATGIAPQISLLGTDSDIDFRINAKGTGNIQISDISYPNADGVPGQVLTTDGLGNITFQTAPTAILFNILIAANFKKAPWQRGITFTSATTPANNDDTYLADRWILLSDGNDIVDVAKDTDGSLKSTVVTSNTKFGYVQILENLNSIEAIGESVSVSIRAKSAGINNMRVGVLAWDSTIDVVTSDVVTAWNGSGADPSLATNWTYENTPSDLVLTTGFQTFTIQNIPIDTANTNNIGLFFWIDDTTAIIGSTLNIERIKVEVAPAATAFVEIPYAVELRNAQRYYEKTYNQDVFPGASTSIGSKAHKNTENNSTDFQGLNYSFKINKRITPTVTVLSPISGASGFIRNVTGAADVAVASLSNTGDSNSGYINTGTNVANNNVLTAHFVAEAEL